VEQGALRVESYTRHVPLAPSHPLDGMIAWRYGEDL